MLLCALIETKNNTIVSYLVITIWRKIGLRFIQNLYRLTINSLTTVEMKHTCNAEIKFIFNQRQQKLKFMEAIHYTVLMLPANRMIPFKVS